MKKTLLCLVLAAILTFVACTGESYQTSTSTIPTNSASLEQTETSSSQKPTHTHTFSKATCVSPKKCTDCGAVSGKALGHTYSAATCTSPKKCTRCNATSGEALGHKYSAATCTSPKKCTRCQKTSGKALSHKDNGSGTCSFCGENILLNALRKGVTATLIVPRTGSDKNFYCEMKVVNNSGYTILMPMHVFANGFGCANTDVSDTPLSSGYQTTASYYRSIVAHTRYDDKYADMYLDNQSSAYCTLCFGDERIRMTFDTAGNTMFELL